MKPVDDAITVSIQRWRFALVLGVFALLLAVIAGRLVMLHTIEQPFLFEQGEKRTVRSETQVASRGMVTDRFGQPLAVSTPVVNLWVNPQQANVDEVADLAKEMGLKRSELYGDVVRAKRQGRSFYYIKRQVQPDVAQRLLKRRIAGVYGEDDFR
ncbi:MAG: penicillin-binding protein 2, partial [Oleibacter sp.]|nr:penicillin-binding protein 2 [Thalassolituus sp.]